MGMLKNIMQILFPILVIGLIIISKLSSGNLQPDVGAVFPVFDMDFVQRTPQSSLLINDGLRARPLRLA